MKIYEIFYEYKKLISQSRQIVAPDIKTALDEFTQDVFDSISDIEIVGIVFISEVQ